MRWRGGNGWVHPRFCDSLKVNLILLYLVKVLAVRPLVWLLLRWDKFAQITKMTAPIEQGAVIVILAQGHQTQGLRKMLQGIYPIRHRVS